MNRVRSLLLGCLWQTQSRTAFSLFVFFFSVSVKVLPVTPLLSGVFVHRALAAARIFLGSRGYWEMRRFLWWTHYND